MQREEIATFQVKSFLRYTLCVANKTQRVPMVIKQINTMKWTEWFAIAIEKFNYLIILFNNNLKFNKQFEQNFPHFSIKSLMLYFSNNIIYF